MPKTVPYKLRQQDAESLKRSVKKFRRLLTEAGSLAATILAFVETYGPLQDTEGDMMRAIARKLKDDIHIGRALDAKTVAERLSEIQAGEVNAIH